MADEVRKTNPYIRYGLLVVIVAIFLWNYYQGRKPLLQTGILEYRMVAGNRDGQFQVIMLETADRYVILDSAFRQVLVTEDGELISRPKQLKLLESYGNIEYRVCFDEQSTGLQPGYRTSRELFNSLTFGKPVKYEVNRKVRDSVMAIVNP
jgi:hypothetical protein